jgi:hypothetical protein
VPELSGPLEGLNPLVMRGQDLIDTVYEDFDKRLLDVQQSGGSFPEPNDFTRSEWVCTEQGTLGSGALLRMNCSSSGVGSLSLCEASSVMVTTPGTTANTGINCQHLVTGRCNDTPCSHFDFLDVNYAVAFQREYRWAASIGLGKDTDVGWDNKLAIGMSLPDTDVMNNTTGVISVGTGTGQWGSDGGFLFNIEPDGELRVYVNSEAGGLQVLGPVNLFSWLSTGPGSSPPAPYLKHLQIGAVWSNEDTDGVDNGGPASCDDADSLPFDSCEGRFKAFYRIPVGNELEIYGPWIQIGDELVGYVLWSTAGHHVYTHEVVNGSVETISLFDDWVAGGITREMLLP